MFDNHCKYDYFFHTAETILGNCWTEVNHECQTQSIFVVLWQKLLPPRPPSAQETRVSKLVPRSSRSWCVLLSTLWLSDTWSQADGPSNFFLNDRQIDSLCLIYWWLEFICLSSYLYQCIIYNYTIYHLHISTIFHLRFCIGAKGWTLWQRWGMGSMPLPQIPFLSSSQLPSRSPRCSLALIFHWKK